MAELPSLNPARAEGSHWLLEPIKHNFGVGRTVSVAKDMDENQRDLRLSPSFDTGCLGGLGQCLLLLCL